MYVILIRVVAVLYTNLVLIVVKVFSFLFYWDMISYLLIIRSEVAWH